MITSSEKFSDLEHGGIYSTDRDPLLTNGSMRGRRVTQIGPRNDLGGCLNVVCPCVFTILFGGSLLGFLMCGAVGASLWSLAGSSSAMLISGQVLVGIASLNLVTFLALNSLCSCASSIVGVILVQNMTGILAAGPVVVQPPPQAVEDAGADHFF